MGGDLGILNYSVLTDLTGLNDLAYVGGDLLLMNNPSLTRLTGLNNLNSTGGCVYLYRNDLLTNLSGLNNLTSIGSYLYIELNLHLNSLTGLDNLEAGSIDSLYITGNPMLSDCAVQSICNYLASPNGPVEIYGNKTGCNNQQEVQDACESIGMKEKIPLSSITIYPNPAYSSITIETKCKYDIYISDMKGQQFFHEERNEPIVTIDVGKLQNGVYVVKLVGEKGVQVRKFLKE
jgi:hypothetical protein